MKKIAVFGFLAALLLASGTAFALKDWSHQRTPVAFYTGHTHGEDGHTVGGPQHSGGTNAYGCHNGSVPYHCH